MKKIISSIALLAAGTLLLAGCATSPESSLAGQLTTPKGMSSVSNSDGKFVFTSLVDGKNSSKLDTVCNDVFDWAAENKFIHFRRVDNSFNLVDYDNENGVTKDKEAAVPFIAACQGDVDKNITLKNAINAGTPNENMVFVFFGRFGEDEDKKMVGNAWLKVNFEGTKKFVTLTGEFFDQLKPVEKAVSSPSTGESPKANN